MKKILWIAVLAVSLSAPAQHNPGEKGFQQRDANGVPFRNFQPGEILPLKAPAIITAFSYDTVRALTELNVSGYADAYPWISPDGLRLYYSCDTAYNRLLIAKRETTADYFGSPAPVQVNNLLIGAFSCWLSNDELDLYLANGDGLYYSNRTDTNSPFSEPVPINLTGIPFPVFFISGPSFNEAQDHLFAYFVSENGEEINEFIRNSPDEFIYSSKMTLPSGSIPGPGQLSKDGLAFFIPVSYSSGSPALLYQLTRTTVADTFFVATFQQIEGINDNLVFNGQPSMSDSLEWVAFVRSHGSWDDDDLYLAHGGMVTPVFDPEKRKFSVSLFPNPALDEFYIETPAFKNASVEIWSSDGKLVQTVFLKTEKTSIKTGNLSVGCYLVKIITVRGVQVKKLMKSDYR